MITTETTPLAPDVFGRLVRRRADLLAALEEALAEAAGARHDPAEVEDFKELAQEQAGQAVQDVEAALIARQLSQVEAALRRIEAGRYGHCTECGDPIAPARLLALPEAALCAACQSDAERHRRALR